jgi:hypothetical protein
VVEGDRSIEAIHKEIVHVVDKRLGATPVTGAGARIPAGVH